LGGGDQKFMVQGQPREILCVTLSQKYPTQKRAGGVAQVVEYLTSKCEVLSLSPSTAKYIHIYICLKDLKELNEVFHTLI
jgi:hypothetical protein